MLTVVGIRDIVIRIKHDHGYSSDILKRVIHVPFLGRNLFSSYIAAQKKFTRFIQTQGVRC